MNFDTINDTIEFVNDVRVSLGLDQIEELVPGVRGDCDECPITNSIMEGLGPEWLVETALHPENPYVAVKFNEDVVEDWNNTQRLEAWRQLLRAKSPQAANKRLTTDEDGLNPELRFHMTEAACEFVAAFDESGDLYAGDLVL